jgi:glycosyltransferase involved in cell wall biosynthesis
MKKILFISYFFPPIRSVESAMAVNLAKFLPAKGYALHVLHARDPKGFGREETKLPSGIETTAVRAPSSFLTRALYSLKLISDPEVAWLPHAFHAARRLFAAEKFDLIFSRANPVSSHSVALRLKRLSNLPWIAFYGDPGAQHPYISYRFPFLKRLHERRDAEVVQKADAVIVTTEETRRIFAGRYGHGEKIFVLPNTFDPELFAPAHAETQEGNFSLVYAGSFYNLRSPEKFLRGLSRFFREFPEARAETRITFMGNMGKFGGLVRSLGLADVVEIQKEKDRAATAGVLSGASALLLIDADIPHSPFLPAKAVEYIAVGKPILALTPPDGESARAVLAADAGVVVPPSDTDAIADAIGRMWKSHREGNLKNRVKAEEVKKYDARSVAEEFAKIAERLTF